jgi:hypothetical protein
LKFIVSVNFAPGGVGSSHFYAIIDDYRLPGNFDCRSHNPFCAFGGCRKSANSRAFVRHLQQPELIATARVQASEQRQSEQREDELLSPHPILPES